MTSQEDVKEKTLLSTNDFQSGEIELHVERHRNCYTKFKAKVGAKLLGEAKEEAAKVLSKEVSVPGFRKGRAPKEIIIKRFPDLLEKKHRDVAADLLFKECLELASMRVLPGSSRINYEAVYFDPSSGAEFIFEFENELEIPNIDFDKIDISSVHKEPTTEDKIDQTIEQIRGFYSEVIPITDRPAQEGDRVCLDIDDLDTEPPSRALSNQYLMVNKTGMADWIRELVIGMSLDESREAVSRPNEEDSDSIKKEFSPKKCKITLTKIQQLNMPEIDDALAKRVGVDDLKQLRHRLKDLLDRQAEERYIAQLRETIASQLVKNFKFELPFSILTQEIQSRVQSLFSNPHFQHGWTKKTKEEQAEFHKEMLQQSTDALTLFFLCRKLIIDHKIHIPDATSPTPPETLIDAMFSPHDQVDPATMSEEQKSLDLSRRMLHAAQDYIADKLLRPAR